MYVYIYIMLSYYSQTITFIDNTHAFIFNLLHQHELSTLHPLQLQLIYQNITMNSHASVYVYICICMYMCMTNFKTPQDNQTHHPFVIALLHL
jgi:hypothetical protein